MRLALLYQDGNFVGREYFSALAEAGLAPEIVAPVGVMKDESIKAEIERTGGLWNPPPIPQTSVTHRFAGTSEEALGQALTENKIDVAIQGGIGILKGGLLTVPRIGWLNVHPGKLPEYRGNACPEWAVLNGDPVVATAHLIDAGIDTGPVICEGCYDFGFEISYFEFRAGLYRHCGRVLLDALGLLGSAGDNPAALLRPQRGEARYWPPLGSDEREAVRGMFGQKPDSGRERHAS